MPYVVRWIDEGRKMYLGKNGWNSVVSDLGKARVFSGIGAVKNSLVYREVGVDTQIVEVQMQETGVVLDGYALINSTLSAREEEERAREIRDQERKIKAELAELKRLKEKYHG